MTVNDLHELVAEIVRDGQGKNTVVMYDDVTAFDKKSDFVVRVASDSHFVFIMKK